MALLIVLLVLNSGYLGVDTFRPLETFKFRSLQFQSLVETFSVFKSWPVPVPKAIIEGWDLLQFHKEVGPGKPASTYGGVYVLGNTYPKGAVWFYYLVMAAIKFPISILILLLSSLLCGVTHFNSNQFYTRHIFYILPMVFFALVLLLFNTFQSGVRHLLLIYPLLMMSITAGIICLQKRWKKTTVLVIILFASMLASQLYYFPNLIPYTNEILLDKKNAFKITIDTNLDYGHYSRYLNTFLLKNPEYKKAPLAPQTGKFILAIHDVYELRPANTKAYDWILQLEPVEHYKFCYLLFNVTAKDMERSGLHK